MPLGALSSKISQPSGLSHCRLPHRCHLAQNGNGSVSNAEMATTLSALITRADELLAAINALKQKSEELTKVATSAQSRWKKIKAAEDKARPRRRMIEHFPLKMPSGYALALSLCGCVSALLFT